MFSESESERKGEIKGTIKVTIKRKDEIKRKGLMDHMVRSILVTESESRSRWERKR